MPRKTIQKMFYTTHVQGQRLDPNSNQMVPCAFDIDRRVGRNTAQRMVRKAIGDDTFVAFDVTSEGQMYMMDFDTFRRYATPSDGSPAVDENPDEA